MLQIGGKGVLTNQASEAWIPIVQSNHRFYPVMGQEKLIGRELTLVVGGYHLGGYLGRMMRPLDVHQEFYGDR